MSTVGGAEGRVTPHGERYSAGGLSGSGKSDTVSSEFRPVIPGFYPDPTVCRVGDDYYLATSSFEYFPGAPLFHSRDLVSWVQVGNILTTPEQFVRGAGLPSAGIYGSTLRHHGGRFWFVTTNMDHLDAGQLLVTSVDPIGQWSEPVHIPDAVGIDPDLAWDGDGTCLLTWNAINFRGSQAIMQAPLDLASGNLLGEPYPVWQGSGMAAAEGPHLYSIGGWWYLVLAEGGTERGHAVTVARSRAARGPFEGYAGNPLLTRRSSGHPVQNVGHADLVQTDDGSWAAVYLGVRARGSSPGFHVLGRETFLAGVQWAEGWPRLVPGAFDVPPASTSFIDPFDGDLHPRWVSPAGDPSRIAQHRPGGGLRFLAEAIGSDDLVCARVRDLQWAATADIYGCGRFVLRLDDRHWYALHVDRTRVRAHVRIGDITSELGSVDFVGPVVTLEIESVAPAARTVPFGRAGPDEIVLSVIASGKKTPLARMDGRYLSTEVASGFTGRVLGVGGLGQNSSVLAVHYRAGAV